MQPTPPTSSELWDDPRGPSDQELERLRELLFGQEIDELAELKARLDALGIDPRELAEKLPEAIALRTNRDDTLGEALAPTISHAFDEAVQRNPQKITDAIFPIIGPAIRRAIAETISGLVQTINQAFEHSLSPQGLKWRLESWRTGVPYGEVVITHSLVYRVEHVYLIHKETGLLLNQVTAEGIDAPDADVISGMLTAIRDFVHDSFAADEDGGLSRVTVATTTVHVQDGPIALIAAAVRGHPPESLDTRLTGLLERIHLLYRPALAAFDGDPAPLAPTTPILEEALEVVTSREKGGAPGPLASRLVWGVVGVVALVAIGLSVRGTLRWRAALAELEATPGIVVVEAHRGWRTWRLSGLADRDAPNPDLLLAARHDSARVDASWEPYLSFHPGVVAARARRLLRAPPGVELELRGDTLVAAGHATPAWVREARGRLGAVAGVAALEPGALTFDVPETLAARRATIERYRIAFAVGSAEFDAVARATLDSLAGTVRDAIAAAAREAFGLQLEMTGRADSTGTPEVNRRLSDARSANVRTYLAARGVPLGIMQAQGNATRQTDRSVTFVLTFIPSLEIGRVPE